MFGLCVPQLLMQLCQKGDYPGKSAITFLSMIDMDTDDLYSILSTLKFVSRQAQKYEATPIDQPLYMKAVHIVIHKTQTEGLQSVILMLGGFHTQKSVLVCIERIMRGSELKEVLERVYASNAVGHMERR